MANNTTAYGRQKIQWPDLGSDPGSTLHGQIVSAVQYVSNNLVGRWSGSLSFSIGQTIQIEHNFGLAVGSLKVVIVEAGVTLSQATIASTVSITQVSTDIIAVQNISGASKTLQIYVYPHFSNIRASDIDPAIDISTSGSLYFQETLAGQQAANTQSGSAVTLTQPLTLHVVLTNASLNSIEGIAAPSDSLGRVAIFTNNTGNIVTLLNDSGTAANRVLTDTGANIVLEANASIIVKYDTSITKWRIIGSVGGNQVKNQTLSQIAGVEPSLDLIFDNPRSVDAVTFARATQATFIDEDGYLKIASANTPRIEYDPITTELKGLLIEEQRSNLFQQTERFDDSYWTRIGSNIVANTEIAPDGTYTADKLIVDSTAGNHYLYRNNIAIPASTTCTFSVYLKAAEVTWARLFWDNDSGNEYGTYVNLSTGAFGSTITAGTPTATDRKIEAVGNGWYRVSIITNFGATAVCDPIIWLAQGDLDATIDGDGKSGFYIWGAQLETGAFPTSYIPSVETFTSRASTATYYDSTGLVKTAAVNEARTSYNPDPARLHLAPKLLLEPSRTNLFLQSEDFSQTWINENSTESASTITTPDGSSVSKNILITGIATGNVGVIQSYSATIGVAFTVSFFVKRGTATDVFAIRNLTQSGTVYFTPETGTITKDNGTDISGTIQALPNGWYRLSATFVPTSTQTVSIRLRFNSLVAGETAYFWGAQLEEGYEATSYIPTTTVTVTRSADVYTSAAQTRNRDDASMTGTAFTGWYRQDEGTVYCESDTQVNSSSPALYAYRYAISDGTNDNAIYAASWASENRVLAINAGGNGQSFHTISPNTTSIVKVASAFALNNTNAASAGITGTTDTSAILPIVNKLSLGANPAGTSFLLNGHIRRLTFFPERLSNTKLQALTSVTSYSSIPTATRYRAGLMPATGGQIKIDRINEDTLNGGVTVEGVLVKDYNVQGLINADTQLAAKAVAAGNWTTPDTYSKIANNTGKVCYSKELGLLVSVNQAAPYVQISKDGGLTWEAATISSDQDWKDICWSAEKRLFVTIGQASSNTNIATSSDGYNWTIRTAALTGICRSVEYSPELGLFVAVNSSSASADFAQTSTDGITWTTSALPVGSSVARSNALAYSPAKKCFICCTGVSGNTTQNIFYRGTDNGSGGITWTAISGIARDFRSVTWSPELGIFSSLSATLYSITSADGITWVEQLSGIADADFSCITWSSQFGIFLAGGITGENILAYSFDGKTYTSIDIVPPLSSGNSFYSITWVKEFGRFYCVTTNATYPLLISPDVGVGTNSKLPLRETAVLQNVVNAGVDGYFQSYGGTEYVETSIPDVGSSRQTLLCTFKEEAGAVVSGETDVLCTTRNTAGSNLTSLNTLNSYLRTFQNAVALTSSNVICDGKWHTVAAIIDTTLMTQYVDGLPIRSDAITLPTTEVATTFRVGASNSTQNNAKSIARASLFNYALSADKIRRYSIGAPLDFDDVGGSMTSIVTGDDATFDTSIGNWTPRSSFGTLTLDTTNQRTGAGCLKYTCIQTGTQYLQISSKLTIGKRYRIGFWAKSPSFIGNMQQVFDGTGSFILGTTISNPAMTSSYQYYEFEGVSSTSVAAALRLSFTTMSTTTPDVVYIDDVSVIQLGAIVDLDTSGVSKNTWYDASGNNAHGRVNGMVPAYYQKIVHGDEMRLDGSTYASSISNIVYQSKSFAAGTATGDTAQTGGLFFSPDGRKMYTTSASDKVYQFTLSTPWDVSTATYDSVSFTDAQAGSVYGVVFSNDGTQMIMLWDNEASSFMRLYTLSTPWNVGTAVYASKSLTLAAELTQPRQFTLSYDGLRMYLPDGTVDKIYQYALTAAWDISTATKIAEIAITSTVESSLSIAADGRTLLVLNQATTDVLYVYNLPTPWDITTATLISTTTIAQDTLPLGVFLRPNGQNIYVLGGTNDTVYQYSCSSISESYEGNKLLRGNSEIIGNQIVYGEMTVERKIISDGPVTLPSSTLTIASDTITVSKGYHKIAGEGGLADNLATINGGTDGQVLVLRASNDAVTITVKDGTGNLELEGDCTLDSDKDTITLIYDAALTKWLEIARANNGV